MEVNLGNYNDTFVLHFGGEFKRINAYTLASSLVAIADAVKSANSHINPGYEVEVVVEAIEGGSFKAQVRTLYNGAANLFTAENAKAIALSVVAAFVYQHTLAPDSEVNVIVNDDSVVIEQGDDRIIVPREVHEAVKEIEKRPQFRSSVARAFEAVANDGEIESFGITESLKDEEPAIKVPKERLGLLASEILEPDIASREIVEVVELQIVRAILERSKRRWEFVWRGIKIPAPVLDQKFYDDFFAHKITIAPGDVLRASMKIHQEKDEDTGIFINKKYEVLEVQQHIPRMRQTRINIGEGGA